MEYNEKVILTTLIYSDIFHYPLTKEELWQYAVHAIPAREKRNFFTHINKKSTFYACEKGYYFLAGKESFVSLRLQRQHISKEKLKIVRHIAHILSFIPTLRFIGISGSVSMMHANEDDDIDIFIITQSNTIWLSRLLVLGLLELCGKRRSWREKKVKNKICANLFLDESELTFPRSWHDVYISHEIAQLKPLVNKGDTYEKFLFANQWIKDFLPNTVSNIEEQYKYHNRKNNSFLLLPIVTFVNFLAKKLQLWYMKEHHTSEIITDSLLAFYPGNRRKNIIKEYKKRLQHYNITTVSFFW